MSFFTSRALLAPVIPVKEDEQQDEMKEQDEKHTHRCTEPSIDFENSELVQVLGISLAIKFIVGYDLILGRRFDAIPVSALNLSRNYRKAGMIAYRSWLCARSAR